MIRYKGYNLAKASHAAELYDKKEFEKLDKHLKQIENAYIKMQGGPGPEILINYKIGEHPEDWK